MLDTHKFPATSTGQRLLLRLSHRVKTLFANGPFGSERLKC